MSVRQLCMSGSDAQSSDLLAIFLQNARIYDRGSRLFKMPILFAD
jgi:hypothetical protein